MNTFDVLKEKFKIIQNKGFIKSVNSYKNGGGLTLESELGSTGGDFNIPDFYDIEIKSIYKYRFQNIELFNSAPDGIHFPAIPWICDNFGYPDRDYKNIKVLKGDVYGSKKCYIGYKYEFILNVRRNIEKVVLEVYEHDNLVNDEIYWDFDTLKDKLERKDKKLAIFIFNKLYKNNSYYYKYEKLFLYELKSFDDFISLIEKGIIKVTFKAGVHKSGKYMGTFSDHGTSFRIDLSNIEKLFDRY